MHCSWSSASSSMTRVSCGHLSYVSPVRVLLSWCSFLSNQRRLVNHDPLMPSCPPSSSNITEPTDGLFVVITPVSITPIQPISLPDRPAIVRGRRRCRHCAWFWQRTSIATDGVRVPSNHALLRDYSGITRDCSGITRGEPHLWMRLRRRLALPSKLKGVPLAHFPSPSIVLAQVCLPARVGMN
jgi:hypothetical protein